MWGEIADVINKGKKFIITSHLFLEGDAIGSEIALMHFLRDLGKDVVILNNEALPVVYRYFDPNKDVKFLKREGKSTIIQDYDAIFIVDVGSLSQLGDFADKIQSIPIKKVCIDHHSSNPGFGDINVINKDASSAGEMIFELITYMNGKITKKIAEPLYLAITTDTGWFKFSNTSPRAFSICSTLLECGVMPERIYDIVCQSKSWSYLKMTTLALEALQSNCKGRLAWIKLTREMVKSSGVEYIDTDILIDLIRSVSDVEVVVLFRELGTKKTKMSFRSKQTVNVNKLASVFGGGGHIRAAGATISEPIDSVVKKVISEAKTFME